VRDVVSMSWWCSTTPQPTGGMALLGMCVQGSWYNLRVRPRTEPMDDPVESLDVQILYNTLLSRVLGIGDPREDERIR